MQSFRVRAVSVDEFVTTKGQKIQALHDAQVAVRRPDRLRTDRVGPVADAIFRYDGKSFSVYGKRTGYYATAPAPRTIDAAIDDARERFGIDAPAADLLLSQPYEALMEDVVSGRYVGLEPIDGVPCHHLAFQGKDTDWQIWIQDGRPLPRRYVITSKDVDGQPEYTVSLASWEPDAPLADDTFSFQPPPGSTRIDFIPQSKGNR